MFYQTDPDMPIGVQKEGCDWFSVLGMCERTAKKLFTKQQIIDLYNQFKGLRFTNWKGERRFYLEGNADVQNPDGICDIALLVLGDTIHKIRQVGRKSPNGQITYWDNIIKAGPKYMVVDFLIHHYITGRGGPHYILADAVGNILFDSYDKPYERAELVESFVYNVQPHEEE
jgi:hypothetical protein